MAAVAILMTAYSHSANDGGEGGFSLPNEYSAPLDTTMHSRWFTDMAKSESCQAVLLSAIIGLAAHTGDGLLEFTQIGAAIRILLLACLVIFAMAVIGSGISDEACSSGTPPTFLILFTTIALLTASSLPIFVESLLIPCRLVAFALALPYVAMCPKQADEMHATVTIIIVLPSLLMSNIITDTSRYVLLIPAVTFIAYKSTAICCSYFMPRGDLARKVVETLLQIGIFIAGAAILVVTMAAAEIVAADPQQTGICSIGMVVIIASCIALNACLVALRWKKTDKDVVDQLQRTFGSSLFTLKKSFFRVTITVILMIVALSSIYACLAFQRRWVTLPACFVVCLYFLFVYVDGPSRTYLEEESHQLIHNSVFFFLTLGSLSIAGLAAAYMIPPGQSVENTTLIFDEFHDRILRQAASFATLQSCLLFIYLMMTTLFKTDKQAKLAAEDAFVRVLSRATATTDAAEPAAAKRTDVAATGEETDRLSENSEENSIRICPIHVSLNDVD